MKSRPNPFRSLIIPLMASAASLVPVTAGAATLYWKTSAANSWTGSFWGSAVGGPYSGAYTSGSDVVFEDNGGTLLTITGATTNFASITANENVTVTASGTLGTGGTVASITVANGKTLDLQGQNISTAVGTGLIKNGAGTLSLANGNAYAGGFTLNAGTVQVGGVNALGSGGALTLNGGILSSNSTTARDLSGKFAGGIIIGGDITLGDATNTGNLTFSNGVALGSSTRTFNVVGATAIFNGVISGTGAVGIVKTGSGSLEFGTAANNTFTGNSAIRAGNVFVRHANAFGTAGTLTLGNTTGSDSATLRLTSLTFTRPIILETGTTGTLTINNLGAGATPTYQGGVTGTNNLTIQSVIGGAGTSVTTFNTTAINHTGALTLSNSGTGSSTSAIGTVLIDSAIGSNVTSLTVSDSTTGTKGLQRAVLGSTSNAYTGNTTISSGARLELSASEVLPDGTGKGDVIVNGTLDLRGGSETINGLTGSGSITRSTTGSSTLTVGGNNVTSSFGGVIANASGTVSLTKTGTGTLTLTAANTYSGDTTVNSGGTLQLDTVSQVLASGSGKGNAIINGTLDLRIAAQTLNGLSGTGTLTRSTSGSSSLTVGGNNATSTFGGAIENGSGTLALVKTGTGTLTLTNASTYSGGTSLGSGAGVLEISNGSALGTGTVALSKAGTSGGTLNLTGGISVANNFTFSSATGFGGGGSAHIRNISGDNTLSGNLTLNTAGGNGINLQSDAGSLTVTGTVTSTIADNTRQLGLGGVGNGEVSGQIKNTGSNAFSVIKTGSGTWTLSGANTYTGSTDLNGGVLALGSSGAIGSTGAINLNGGTLQHSASNTTDYSSRFSTAASQSYKVDTNGHSVTWASNLTSSGGTLTKSGSGTLTLTGASSTYTGTTTVSAGTLLINGALGSTALTINSGATLGGSGSTSGSVSTVSATSVIAPGNSPGTLTIGSLDVTNGATLNFELGTNSDLLVVTGAVTSGGPLNFNFSDSGGLVGYTAYTLFTFTSSDLDYADLNAITLPGQALDTSFGTGGWMINSGSLQVQFVPEPESALLGGVGLLLLLRRRRR